MDRCEAPSGPQISVNTLLYADAKARLASDEEEDAEAHAAAIYFTSETENE